MLNGASHGIHAFGLLYQEFFLSFDLCHMLQFMQFTINRCVL